MILLCTLLPLLLLLYIGSAFVPTLFCRKGFAPQQPGGLTIIGHRGGALLGPENTLTCISRGMQAGADMIEVDIHLSADGELIVCHDQTVDRTTNGKGRIRDLTAAQLRQLRIVDADGQLTDEHLPTLDEVLTLVGGRCRLLVEIKRTQNIYQGIEQKLLQAISRHHAEEWVVVQSFNDSVLFTIHQLAPRQRIEKLLFMKLPLLPVIFDGTFTTFSYDKYGDVASFNFFYHALNTALIDDLHAHGKEIKMWTLKQREEAPHWPVDGIITNRPDGWK